MTCPVLWMESPAQRETRAGEEPEPDATRGRTRQQTLGGHADRPGLRQSRPTRWAQGGHRLLRLLGCEERLLRTQLQAAP